MIEKKDFTQVDSHWIYISGGNYELSVKPGDDGFSLTVNGILGPIPPATQYPTEPEWEVILKAANKFEDARKIAESRE